MAALEGGAPEVLKKAKKANLEEKKVAPRKSSKSKEPAKENPKETKAGAAVPSHKPPKAHSTWMCYLNGPRDHEDAGGWKGVMDQMKEKGEKVDFKIAGEMWRELPAKEKERYEAMHTKEQKVEEARIEAIRKKGHYIMADGSKSTDEKNAQLFTKKVKK